MLHPDTYLKMTPKGLGLFAKRRFERGAILWIEDDVDSKFPLSDYLAMDELQQQKLNTYSFLDYQNQVFIHWDEAKYINHSCAANSTGLLEFHNISIATRTIEPDEEITENYHCYFGHFESFTCTCGAPDCQGTVTQVDSYRADLRLRLADIQDSLRCQPQPLLAITSIEKDAFLALLHGNEIAL